MFLKFWIISSIICIINFNYHYYLILGEVKKNFTKEEIKNFDKDHSSKFEYIKEVFMYFCPFFNIIFTIIFLLEYEYIKRTTIEDIRRETEFKKWKK